VRTARNAPLSTSPLTARICRISRRFSICLGHDSGLVRARADFSLLRHLAVDREFLDQYRDIRARMPHLKCPESRLERHQSQIGGTDLRGWSRTRDMIDIERLSDREHEELSARYARIRKESAARCSRAIKPMALRATHCWRETSPLFEFVKGEHDAPQRSEKRKEKAPVRAH